MPQPVSGEACEPRVSAHTDKKTCSNSWTPLHLKLTNANISLLLRRFSSPRLTVTKNRPPGMVQRNPRIHGHQSDDVLNPLQVIVVHFTKPFLKVKGFNLQELRGRVSPYTGQDPSKREVKQPKAKKN